MSRFNPEIKTEEYVRPFIAKLLDKIVDTSVSRSERDFKLRVGEVNVRGIVSKTPSVVNILVDEEFDVLGLTETLLQLEKRPQIKGYFPMFRNRANRPGGGIALLIHDKFKGHVVKEEQGEGDLEYLAVTFTCFEPNVSIVLYYGQQENSRPREEICGHLAAVLGVAEKLHLEGKKVYVMGDFNNHIGDRVFANTNKKVSAGGQSLLMMLDDTDFDIINGMNRSGGSGHTHYDRSSGSSNVLDLVLTNDDTTVDWLEVDEKFQKTPYRWKYGPGGKEKNYSDHCMVSFQVSVQLRGESGFGNRKKITKFRYGKPGGHEAYQADLEGRSLELLTRVSTEPSINEVVEHFYKAVKDASYAGYGITTITTAKLKRVDEEKEWRRRTMEIDEYLKNITAKYSRPMTRVWSARKSVLMEGRYAEESAVKNHWTGEMLREREEIFDFSLEFNESVLRKEESKVGDWSEVRKRKVWETKLAMSVENAESRQPITNKEFDRALCEVAASNKDVYQDLNRAGPMFKYAVKELIQRIYQTGEIPDSFKETTLMKLHKKGPKNVIDNYRWLHLKQWLPKLTEKVVLLKLKDRMTEGTPEFQLGGQPMGSCAEHLVYVNTVLAMRITQNLPTVVHLYDVRKCFDQVNLWDVGWEAAQIGIVGRDLRFLMNINQDIKMRICGDERKDKYFVARDSLGQGMVSACVGSALAIARVVEERFRWKTDKIMIGGEPIKPSGFVDDLASLDATAKAGKDSCSRVSDALDEMTLKAHPTKSVRIVVGSQANREKVEADNAEDPETIQGFEVKSTEKDMYLGMQIHQDGPRASCTNNIELKRARVAVKTQTIIRLLREEKIKQLGWMRAAIGLLQGIVLQVLTYGTEAFIQMTKCQVKSIEKIYKDAVYTVLELSKFANYSAVMFELGLLPAEDIIKLKKINFVNKLVHVKEAGMCLRLLREQQKLTPEKGLLAEVQQYAKEYVLPDVTVNYCDKKVIDTTVKQAVMMRMWFKTLDSSKTFKHWDPTQDSNKSYFLGTKLEAKLMLALRVGELNFKVNRRRESVKKYGGVQCMVGVCMEDDSLLHVGECFGYTARLQPGGGEQQLMEYLKALHAERLAKYKQPLVYIKSV